RGTIDLFIDHQRQASGLQPVAPASPPVLLRRLYLDLVGLPPTEEQLAEFTTDQQPDAYERQVDRLLARPAHGERWARHWMDVWRYSDWDGYGAEVRESQPHIWRWRDWIIESMDADKPYNQMIVEMLAGDELAPADPNTLRATGFLVRNWYKFNRNVWIDNTIEHTGKAFLALTFNCSRCHDHMYDAIEQREYYQLRAIFEPYDVRTDRIPGQADPTKDGLVRAFDAKPDASTVLFTRGDEKQPDKDHPLTANLPKWLLAGHRYDATPITLDPAAYYPGSRAYVHEESLATARQELATAEQAIAPARTTLDAACQKWAAVQAAQAAAPKSPAAAPAAPAPAAPATPAPATPDPKTAQPQLVWADDFSKPNPEFWKPFHAQFEPLDGKLVQREPVAVLAGALSQKTHPRDFQAKLRFKITGGAMWRSMGLSFDADGDQNMNFIYISAYAGGPKLQLASRQAGKDDYPMETLKSLPIELNRDYEMTVLVRDRLVNILLDGQLQLVATCAARRPDGHIMLITYDASGEFDSIEVSALGATQPLMNAAGQSTTSSPPPPAPALDPAEAAFRQAEGALKLADATLVAAQASLAAVEARVSADRAVYSNPRAADAAARSQAAVKAEREASWRQAEQKVAAAEQQLVVARAALKADDPKTAKAVEDADKNLAAQVKAREAAQAATTQINENYTRFSPLHSTTSTGRRLALARWIAADSNPLTPRVAINHLWLRHYGSPLVSSVFDFGMNGKTPTHPELLDWLALELVESGWSMKALHRLLVTSNTYRLASSGPVGDHVGRQKDPENRLFWRMNPRRMEAEAVRDATLLVAGQLHSQRFGPDIDPNLGMTLPRRSVYFRNSKEKKMTFLSLFDSPNVVECYRRSESVAPQQALAMANSGLTLDQSRRLATELTGRVGAGNQPATVQQFIQAAFARILCRPATPTEEQQCVAFLAEQTQRLADAKQLVPFAGGSDSTVKAATGPHARARENLVLVLFNHNDFVTIR
ncbi:MAG: DUF1553 domain-containing protein, partial [Planctomycetota bacterium]